ncbi:MAG: PilZ domain-containing protein [Elusimicrobia bacterium]|nr:PilZ domain-containing protein [Elusimicrobiota bacterium]
MSAIKQSKRRFDRFKNIVLIDIFLPGTFKPRARGCLTDISVGGAGFECTEKFEPGERLDLAITLKSGKEYVFEGVIRRVARSTGTYSYGIEFLEKGFFKRFLIKRFIKKLLKEQAG